MNREVPTDLDLELQSEQIEIGQTVELNQIPQESSFIFRIEGEEDLYCLFRSGEKLLINKIFKEEDGQRKGQWLVVPANEKFAEPNMQVEIVDTYQNKEALEE